MCQPKHPIKITISLPSPRPSPMPLLLPLPSSCLRGCMTLKCGGRVTIWIYNLENKKLCYVEGTLSDMYCCRKKGNKTVQAGVVCSEWCNSLPCCKPAESRKHNLPAGRD